MSALPAAAAEPRHSCGGAGGAARGQEVPSWYRQKVKVPKRVWGSGHYSPGAVAWWAQITALQCRPEHCRASVDRLAGWMGDSKRSGERFLAELSADGPDGIPELTTIRHTDGAGDGETAERYTRAVGRSEHFAYVSVLAAKTLRHRLFVLYCALAYAVATGHPVTMAELAALLGVTESTVRRLVTALERTGWITVHRRTGEHGRHQYEIHDIPLHPVPAPGPRPHTDGGSGAHTDGGSLAIKEDTGLTDERSTRAGGSFRRRRDDGKWVAPAVDTGGNGAAGVPPALRPAPRPCTPPAYAGPPLTLSPRVWAVLAPVRDLLPGCSTFAQRRIAREVGRQLDAGIWPQDIHDQLQRLRTWTPSEAIRDPARWLLGAVLPVRSKCARPGCHFGFLTHTGAPCKVCAEIEEARTRERYKTTHPPRLRTPPRRPLPHLPHHHLTREEPSPMPTTPHPTRGVEPCDYCHAPIRWATGKQGRRIPLNALPSALGQYAARTNGHGGLVVRELDVEFPNAEDSRLEWRALAHWDSCTGPRTQPQVPPPNPRPARPAPPVQPPLWPQPRHGSR